MLFMGINEESSNTGNNVSIAKRVLMLLNCVFYQPSMSVCMVNNRGYCHSVCVHDVFQVLIHAYTNSAVQFWN